MPELATNPDVEWAGESTPTSKKPDRPPSSGGDYKQKYVALPSSPPPPPSGSSSIPRTRSILLAKPIPTAVDYRRRAKTAKAYKDVSLLNAVKANYRFIYRINDGVGTTNTILQKVCEERGWREFREESLFRPGTTPYERALRGATGWNLWWSYSIYQFSPYKYLRNWQFTNHNPKGFQFCNKLYLTMYMRKMQVIHGTTFDFYPLSFIVPEDYLRLSTEHFKRAAENYTEYNHNNLLSEKPTHSSFNPVPSTPRTPVAAYNYAASPYAGRLRPRSSRIIYRPITTSASGTSTTGPPPIVAVNARFNPVWISKPVALSQGKGIFLTTDLNTIATDKKSVVQEYITRPLLIGGYKWDVRIYVCVAAIDPLVIYIYNEGLCRFCTEKYSTRDLSRMYAHLTNASLNKLSPAYEDNKELIGHGCKWSLRKLRQYFKDRHICDWLLWQKVMAIIVLTVIGDCLRLGYSASNKNCFDLFGFDVLVDENLKPWLLECNYSPGLGGDCKTDEVVKIPMLHELFDLLGFPDRNSYIQSESAMTVVATSENCSIGTEQSSAETKPEVEIVETEEVIPYDKDDITRHYFDMLLARLKWNTSKESESEEQKRKSNKWSAENTVKTEARLNDAKTIYSQNLVVQYLKNQSSASKLSKQVREQLISVAAKKLRSKLSVMAAKNDAILKKDKKQKPNSPPSPPDPVPSEKTGTEDEKTAEEKIDENNNVIVKIPLTRSKEEPTTPSATEPPPTPKRKSASASSLLTKIKQEFPAPDTEAFQKLKYYFDAGVDYPMDAKTGKFKECPALISVKKDWFNPVRTEGGWIRVYPFDARTTKSPYKSSLTDVRQAVRSIESYIKVAEHLSMQYPGESDDFFRRKIKAISRRDTEVWVPPSPVPTSSLSSSAAASPPSRTGRTRNRATSRPPSRPPSSRPPSSRPPSRPITSPSPSPSSCPSLSPSVATGSCKTIITDTDTSDPNNNILTNRSGYCWQPSEEIICVDSQE